MKGKICLVTGASSGIGLATSWQLARMGATVVMVARNDERGEAALAKVIEKSGNPNTHLLMADFASLPQVRSLAQKFQAQFPALHVLINNAAIVPLERQVSEDEYELQFAVNHLAPFLLTNLLLPLMKTSQPARIINVSSMVHSWGSIDFDDLQSKRGYSASNVYAMTKLANMLFTTQLDSMLKGTDITVNSLHPGVIDTKLYKNYMGAGGPGDAGDSELERGAATTVYLASSNEVAGVSGKYFSQQQEREPSAASQNSETAQHLWKVSARMVEL
ncbi:MAG: SDR family NAD(P)-dependent oxidoreductase [Gammaproteobacteria bacterium]|nr:SDR family NAD(P)-dependent oxidoreductase [Gammaproteobacteria bacterium]